MFLKQFIFSTYKDGLTSRSVDAGFKTAMDYPFALDTGGVFENIVYLELRRKAERINYLKSRQEVDFYYPMTGKEQL